MKIGVSGANGGLGKVVLMRLKELPGDHQVVGISRSPQNIQHADEARFGDYDAPESLAEAYVGLDRLLIIPTLDLGYGVRGRQLVAAIDAARIAGVGQVVLMSEAATREEAEPAHWAACWTGEQHLIRTAKSWTIVRSGYFMESFAGEMLLCQTVGQLPELGENRVGFVSRDDVAAAAAGILVGDGHSGAIYHATGSETFSVAERASLISSLTGTPIEVAITSIEVLRQQLQAAGYPAEYIGIALETKQKTAGGGYDIVTGDVERLSGRRPVSLSDVLSKYLAQAAQEGVEERKQAKGH